MKKRYHIMMQQRHLSAIVGALRFRQQLTTGNLTGTFGKAAMEAWHELPMAAYGPYPARIGNVEDVQKVVNNICESLLRIVWQENQRKVRFDDSPGGRLAGRILPQRRQMARHTSYRISVDEKDFAEMSSAVEFEMRTRIGHLDLMDHALLMQMRSCLSGRYDVQAERRSLARMLERVKNVAWQIEDGGNYGPWFSYKTRFLYDIYSVFQHEIDPLHYEKVNPILSNVPLMEVKKTY